MIRETNGSVELDVRVIPRARKTSVAGVRNGVHLVRLAAPPVEGAANDCLIEHLAERLGVTRRDIRIVSGERSRQKRLSISGISVEEVRRRLG